MTKPPVAHPYMANSAPRVKEELLAAVGAASVDELFEQIPPDHRLSRPLELPCALRSEVDLSRHLRQILSRNQTCEENLNFLGAGCWQHYVPAVVDEIVGRTEFLTPVWGTPASDLGRNQAWFEFCSQIGELVDMDFVGLPVYSWGCAAGHGIRMAARITGRNEVLIPRSIDPERLAVIRNYCEPEEMSGHIKVTLVDFDSATGTLDLNDLEEKLTDHVAAVYFDNPSYLGTVEPRSAAIAEMAAAHEAETVVGVDPITLGVLAPPGQYGADIVVGSMQPLGVHMNCGGGAGGFISTRDEERYAREYPTLVLSLAQTTEGERSFGMTLFEQTSYGSREKGKDWTGNSVYLWAIAGATYMSLLGPAGFKEIGELIVARSRYAALRAAELNGVHVAFSGPFFKEFVLDFNDTGRTVSEINSALLKRGIFGGKDLSADFPALGQVSLYCVTEVHTQEDIDRLITALGDVLA